MRMWQKSGPLIIEEMATWREGVGSVEKMWPKSGPLIIEEIATWREVVGSVKKNVAKKCSVDNRGNSAKFDGYTPVTSVVQLECPPAPVPVTRPLAARY